MGYLNPKCSEEIMINPDILVATSNWFMERGFIIDSRIGLLFSTMFYVLDALQGKVSTLSLASISGKNDKKVGSKYAMSLGMFVSPDNYANFRSVLSLVGDLYHILEGIKKYDLFELKPLIDSIYKKSDDFRDVRNFFTHLDVALNDLQKHGVSGELKTNCGIEYQNTAKNCFHLIIDNETIYFTWQKKALEKNVGKSAYIPIFDDAKLIYAELISHKLNQEGQNYLPVDKLFPLL